MSQVPQKKGFGVTLSGDSKKSRKPKARFAEVPKEDALPNQASHLARGEREKEDMRIRREKGGEGERPTWWGLLLSRDLPIKYTGGKPSPKKERGKDLRFKKEKKSYSSFFAKKGR